MTGVSYEKLKYLTHVIVAINNNTAEDLRNTCYALDLSPEEFND